MNKKPKITPALIRNVVQNSNRINYNIGDDPSIDTDNRVVMEQQCIADYQQLARKVSNTEQAIKKIRSSYELSMEKVLGQDGVNKLNRISSKSLSVVLKATDEPMAHNAIAEETTRLKEKKNRSYKTLLKKTGVSEKKISDIKKAYATKVGRRVEPLMKPTDLLGGSGGGNTNLPQSSIDGYAIKFIRTLTLGDYHRSFFNEYLDDASVTPGFTSIPEWGVIGNSLRFTNRDPGDFDASAGVLQNQFGSAMWAKQGDKLGVQFDITCVMAAAKIKADDEFGISHYSLDLASNICVSIGNKTRTKLLWRGSKWGDDSGKFTVIGTPPRETKTFTLLFDVPKTTTYIVWVGLKDSYYCFQNDFEIDLSIENTWDIDKVKVTRFEPTP